MAHSFWKSCALLTCATLLSSCLLGPDFKQPAPPDVKKYTPDPQVKTVNGAPKAGKAGVSQTLISKEDVPQAWWDLFHSQEIRTLVCRGLQNSPNLERARFNLNQAEQILRAKIGNNLFPAFDASIGATRQSFNTATVGTNDNASTTFSLYNSGLTLSYTFDVFGGLRREIEASAAHVDYQKYQWVGAYVTLSSNIVTSAITIASLQAQIDATKALIQESNHLLALVKQQYALGAVSGSDVAAQETQTGEILSRLPPLEKALAQAHDGLAVLLGTYPGSLAPIKINLDAITLPKKLPLSLPSELVRQRPDILAAEAVLHEACAKVGVATANLYPKFTISGLYGFSSTTTQDLFGNDVNVWTYGGQILQPIFHGGALLADKRAAEAQYQAALSQYKETVLKAFQNVADTLRILQTDADALQAQTLAVSAAKATLDITQQQYRLGGVSFINVLNAEQQYQKTKILFIQAKAARYADTAALFQALGGGWWHDACLNPQAKKKTDCETPKTIPCFTSSHAKTAQLSHDRGTL